MPADQWISIIAFYAISFYILFDRWKLVTFWATVWKFLFYGADKLTWVTVILSTCVHHSAADWNTIDAVSLR